MTFDLRKVPASHFWGSLTTTFCYMPRICREVELAPSTLSLEGASEISVVKTKS